MVHGGMYCFCHQLTIELMDSWRHFCRWESRRTPKLPLKPPLPYYTVTIYVKLLWSVKREHFATELHKPGLDFGLGCANSAKICFVFRQYFYSFWSTHRVKFCRIIHDFSKLCLSEASPWKPHAWEIQAKKFAISALWIISTLQPLDPFSLKSLLKRVWWSHGQYGGISIFAIWTET